MWRTPLAGSECRGLSSPAGREQLARSHLEMGWLSSELRTAAGFLQQLPIRHRCKEIVCNAANPMSLVSGQGCGDYPLLHHKVTAGLLGQTGMIWDSVFTGYLLVNPERTWKWTVFILFFSFSCIVFMNVKVAPKPSVGISCVLFYYLFHLFSFSLLHQFPQVGVILLSPPFLILISLSFSTSLFSP